MKVLFSPLRNCKVRLNEIINASLKEKKMAGFANQSRNNSNDEFQTSEYGLRIGQEWINPDTEQEEFVSLPGVMWLDTMKKNKVSGEGEFQELLLHGNDLLVAVQDFGKTLAPGECRELNLKVQVFRRKANQNSNHKTMTWKVA